MEQTKDYSKLFMKNNFVALIIFIIINAYITLTTNFSYSINGWHGVLFTILCIIWLVWTFNDDWSPGSRSRDEEWYENYCIKFAFIKTKKYKFIFLPLLIIGFIIMLCMSQIKDLKGCYNTSIVYTNLYKQKVDAKKGFYDKLWKTFLQKEKISNINKDVFIKVATIQMENRKDGLNVTWKWCQENTNIDYNEFTKFYADLTNFIETQREAYYQLEIECQNISNAHNTLLDTFPNNIYNKFLKRNHIIFQYGFLSDSTDNVFKTKKENINE